MTGQIREDDGSMESEAEQMMKHIRSLEGDIDAQVAAVLDLEKAFTGAPMADRPLWLRGASHETIVLARQKMAEAVSAPAKAGPKPDTGNEADSHK